MVIKELKPYCRTYFNKLSATIINLERQVNNPIFLHFIEKDYIHFKKQFEYDFLRKDKFSYLFIK